MSLLHRSLAALALASGCLSTADAAPRGLEARDLVTMDRASDPQASPDGSRIAFALRETDLAANKGVYGIWLVPAKGGEAQRVTGKGATANNPRWSNDGKSLYFLSTRSGSQQVWRLDLGGGEAHQVSDYPVDVGSFKVAPVGRQLAFTLEVYTDCDTLACTKKRLDERASAKPTRKVFDKLFFRHWDAWADGRRSQLYAAEPDAVGRLPAEPRRVSNGIDGDIPSKPHGDDSEYSWSPDGKRLAFAARIAGRTEPWSTNFDLFVAPSDGSAIPDDLTKANPAWDSYPVWSRDGGTLYYLAMKRPGYEADRFAVMALDLAGGTAREVNPEWDRSAGDPKLGPDGKSLYVTADDNGEHRLFVVDLAGGKVRQAAGGGQVEGYALAGNAIVIARSMFTSPADLYRVEAGKETRLTSFNRERLADVRMGEFEFYDFKGWNGERVQGYVMKPWNYERGKKYPVAYIVHGGPQTMFGNNFHYRWNPQAYAGAGIAVVAINFHGSLGYGQAFTDAITEDEGGKPLEDLKKGWAAALAKFDFLDGSRACALGASYGGYMMFWMAGNWHEPFKCLVAHDGVFDNRMMGYSTEELWFDEYGHGGTPHDNPRGYEEHNPVNHVKVWKKPILVIHGQQDFRIPAEQGIAAFTAAQRLGIESRFLYFPDENHWVLKPQNSILWHDTVIGWVKRWTE